MRHVVILIVAFAAIAMVNPFFWSIVRMNVAAEPVVYTAADGSKTSAVIGPKAPWPDWVPAPPGSALTVEYAFGPEMGRPATGAGRFRWRADRDAIQQFARELQAAGWTVSFDRYDAVDPSPPFRMRTLCYMTAVSDRSATRGVRYEFALSPASDRVGAAWFQGAPPLVGGEPGCA